MGPVGSSADYGSALGAAGSPGMVTNGHLAGSSATSLAAEAERLYHERQLLEDRMEALAGFLTSEGECAACLQNCSLDVNPFPSPHRS